MQKGARLSLAAGVVAFLVALGIGAIEVSSHSSATGRYPEDPDAATSAKLASAALQLAAMNGDTQPSASAQVVLTTRQAAAQGDIVDTDQQVYAVQITGHFVAEGVSQSEPGVQPPSGTAMTIAFDPQTSQVTDWAMGSPRD